MAEEEPTTTEPPKVPLWKRVIGSIGLVLVLIAVALGTAAVALFFPILRDDQQLDQAVLAVALDWRDFGRDRADQRLALEFADRGIEHARAEDCLLSSEGKALSVVCEWGVEIALPGSNSLPLEFESTATISATGDLH